jgi:hypothetical protein
MGENTSVDITVGIGEEKNLFSSCNPQSNLSANMIDQNAARATKIPNRSEVAALLVVDCHPLPFVVMN